MELNCQKHKKFINNKRPIYLIYFSLAFLKNRKLIDNVFQLTKGWIGIKITNIKVTVNNKLRSGKGQQRENTEICKTELTIIILPKTNPYSSKYSWSIYRGSLIKLKKYTSFNVIKLSYN